MLIAGRRLSGGKWLRCEWVRSQLFALTETKTEYISKGMGYRVRIQGNRVR